MEPETRQSPLVSPRQEAISILDNPVKTVRPEEQDTSTFLTAMGAPIGEDEDDDQVIN